MDPLSDVLSLLKLRSYMSGGWDMGGDWSVKFGAHEGIKCYALVSGQCWLVVDGYNEQFFMKTGDCFLLPRGRPFRLTSHLSLTPVDFREAAGAPLNGRVATINGGGDCSGVGGYFAFEGKNLGLLLNLLPPVLHLQRESDRAAMRWSLERLMEELRNPQPGGSLVAQHLAQMMLVQALRIYLGEGRRGGVGWLFALANKQMCAAMTAMHDDPVRNWTLQELARHAGMSRSTFALKFREAVGTSAVEYLIRWRMLLAGDKLTSLKDPVSAIARSLGYVSESAFSTAFKRTMGCSPREYRRRHAPPPDDEEEMADELVAVAS